ncbi:unnamed protein product [Absidia cylindrospora]
MGNSNSTGPGKSRKKRILPSGLTKKKQLTDLTRPKTTQTITTAATTTTSDSMDRIPIVLENATPITTVENNPFECPHHFRHSAQILQQEDQTDIGTHLLPPSPMLGHHHQHHCCNNNSKRKYSHNSFIDKRRPTSEFSNNSSISSNRNSIASGSISRRSQSFTPPSLTGTAQSRSAPSRDSPLLVPSSSSTSLASLSSGPDIYRHQPRSNHNRTGSPITTGSSNRHSQYSQQWTLTTVNDAYNLDEDEDDDQYMNGSVFLAKDLWRLRSVNRICEAVKDKQRRVHYFLKRVWKGDFLVPLENPSLIIQWACSSGAWCFEMALAYPDCTVIGLDESEGISCTPTVPNMSKHQAPLYEKDGGMAQFEDDSADLIVIRDEFMYFAPDDKWYTLLAQFYRVLKPGGFLEIYGHDFQLHATDPYGKKLDEWTRHLGTSAGVSPDFPQKLEKHCSELGFVETDYRSADLPLGEWPVAPIMKEMGYLAKIIIIKRFQILKRWILGLEENLTEEEYSETIKAGMEECERQQNRFLCFYLAAQKPPR